MAGVQGHFVLFIFWLVTMHLIQAIFKKTRSKTRLPPSPLALPIIGHLHLLHPIPHQALYNLSKKYGPLFHLHLGSSPCVVVSSPEMAKEFLRTHEMSFCNRPSTVAARLLAYDANDFIFAPYGPYWKFMKKITMVQILGKQTIDRFLHVRHEDIESFLKLMLEKSFIGKEVNVCEELVTLANNIISRMTMGKICSTTEHEAGDVREIIAEIDELTGKFNLQDYIWFCKNLDIQGFEKRLKEVHERFDDFMEGILKGHEEERMKKIENGELDDANKNLLDIMIDIMEDDNSDMKLTRESVKAFVLEMFTTATATTSIAMQWALAELINHPSIFKKAREEIDSIIGMNRLVKESDIPNLHYLQAIVRESLRLHPSGPIFARESSQDCSIGGYDIPAKTRLIVNVWALGRDSNYWDNPLEFRPERFMAGKGSTNYTTIDVRGQHYQYLPFGSGRRGCPGTSLGLHIVQTALASMIQCFDWKVINGKDNTVDMTEAAAITLVMANPIMCVPVARPIPILS